METDYQVYIRKRIYIIEAVYSVTEYEFVYSETLLTLSTVKHFDFVYSETLLTCLQCKTVTL